MGFTGVYNHALKIGSFFTRLITVFFFFRAHLVYVYDPFPPKTQIECRWSDGSAAAVGEQRWGCPRSYDDGGRLRHGTSGRNIGIFRIVGWFAIMEALKYFGYIVSILCTYCIYIYMYTCIVYSVYEWISADFPDTSKSLVAFPSLWKIGFFGVSTLGPGTQGSCHSRLDQAESVERVQCEGWCPSGKLT